jgi:proline dehydrogenase
MKKSTYALMDLMKGRNIKADDNHIWFGQLYGIMIISVTILLRMDMCKYISFGPVKTSCLYLIRRAEENTLLQDRRAEN